jgi:hypothetical protein
LHGIEADPRVNIPIWEEASDRKVYYLFSKYIFNNRVRSSVHVQDEISKRLRNDRQEDLKAIECQNCLVLGSIARDRPLLCISAAQIRKAIRTRCPSLLATRYSLLATAALHAPHLKKIVNNCNISIYIGIPAQFKSLHYLVFIAFVSREKLNIF